MRHSMAVLVIFFAALAAACVGEIQSGPPVVDADAAADPGDAAAAADPDAGIVADRDAAAPVVCEPAATQLPNGEHNAGKACLNCHDGGGGAPRFTLAGTLYGPGGTAALSAARIVVGDASGAVFKLATASNGNFYTSQTIVWPATVAASMCPDTTAMQASLASSAQGNCNSCHGTAGSAGKIHLP